MISCWNFLNSLSGNPANPGIAGVFYAVWVTWGVGGGLSALTGWDARTLVENNNVIMIPPSGVSATPIPTTIHGRYNEFSKCAGDRYSPKCAFLIVSL